MIFRKPILRALKAADKKAEILRERAKQRYDAHATPLQPLQPGDIVRVQNTATKQWDLLAQVVEECLRGRSYRVKTESGRVLWRNRRFLRSCPPQDAEEEAVEPGADADLPDSSGPEASQVAAPIATRRSARERRRPARFRE